MTQHANRLRGTTVALAVTTVLAAGRIYSIGIGHEVDISVVHVPKAKQHRRPLDGQEGLLKAEIIPDLLVSDGKRERMQYHAELTSNLQSDAAIAWTVRLFDDVGTDLGKLDSNEQKVGPHAQATTKALSPAVLPDGNYMLRLDASIVSKTGEGSTVSAFDFFEIALGKFQEMAIDEWYRNTRAAELRPLPPDQPPPSLGPSVFASAPLIRATIASSATPALPTAVGKKGN